MRSRLIAGVRPLRPLGVVKALYPGKREVSRAEITEAAVLLGGAGVLTIAGTSLAARVGVAPGWQLATAACGAVLVVGAARLVYYKRAPSWRWLAAMAALWALILVANGVADVRLW